MAKVLVVDDEPAVLNFLKYLFKDAGYQTVGAPDGILALQELFASPPDLAVIDLRMPAMDGVELCRRIREVSHVPIIVLTALERVDDKVRAFAAGADDYVTKPVGAREMLARTEACLRRARWSSVEDPSSIYSDSYLVVDFARSEVYVDGEGKKLTPIEYALLGLLVRQPGESLTLEYLLTNVWGPEYDTFGLVKWHVSNLRKKIERRRGEPTPIVTVRGYGYRYESSS